MGLRAVPPTLPLPSKWAHLNLGSYPPLFKAYSKLENWKNLTPASMANPNALIDQKISAFSPTANELALKKTASMPCMASRSSWSDSMWPTWKVTLGSWARSLAIRCSGLRVCTRTWYLPSLVSAGVSVSKRKQGDQKVG